MSLVDDFKNFISNGSVLDLTVGVITGAAFSKVVSSFTDDIVMPGVALLKNTIQQRVPGASALHPDALAHAAQQATATTADTSAATHATADTSAIAAHTAAAAAPASASEGLATIGYGNFIGAIVYFLIISLIIMLVVKVANRFRKPAEVEVINEPNLEPLLSREETLLTEIRDALRNRA